ncbi:hypothetical protein N431DRAFT_411126 [Stipitochalara longipes BDJ]|nr:hypothetical protein N431DRAFT_411126 [Stipitochalara longipes BDJ]
MSENGSKVVVVATPTSPVLTHLLHALSHELNLEVVVITRETSVDITSSNSHSHNHNHKIGHSNLTHIQTDFSASGLETYLAKTSTVICALTGSDIHLTSSIIDASSKSGVKLFIPSEYNLDTSNPKIRQLLSPYQTRFEIQQKLEQSGMTWKAIYSGIILEDGLKTDGVLGIDALWASVVVFPHNKGTKIAVSTYRDIGKSIVEVVNGNKKVEGNEIYVCSFRARLDEIVAVVEKEIDKPLDRYEGIYEGAKKEAEERMKRGFFDGGVALLGRVAAWNDEVDAWSGWKESEVDKKRDWELEIKKVVKMVRDGELGGGGCGC